MVLEGGDAVIGIESTILDLSRLDSGVGPVLLRPGHLRASQIAEVLGAMPAQPGRAAPRVSGSLKAHYAPRTPMRLVDREELTQGGLLATSGRVAVIVLGTRPDAKTVLAPDRVEWVQAPDEPEALDRKSTRLNSSH